MEAGRVASRHRSSPSTNKKGREKHTAPITMHSARTANQPRTEGDGAKDGQGAADSSRFSLAGHRVTASSTSRDCDTSQSDYLAHGNPGKPDATPRPGISTRWRRAQNSLLVFPPLLPSFCPLTEAACHDVGSRCVLRAVSSPLLFRLLRGRYIRSFVHANLCAGSSGIVCKSDANSPTTKVILLVTSYADEKQIQYQVTIDLTWI
ncbi:hypothetical protein GGS23DRAFT_99877 [Durotheca rogersii]|uniref:uncharacterized protein n=1 Tax=Durotheca rogersii TaxID=419775 RepID=UPI0022208050|nr:uncharacterized protein GGS23DRAFT_99877 [Durotheca rogersii]KAI5862427.1 hypothetical protein GGS23DRAFT_99877 [Durotheca rogersii]